MRKSSTAVVLSVLCLMLSSLLTAATAVGSTTSACTDVWYIGARGSGEKAEASTHGMGPSVDKMSGPVEARARELGLTFGRLAVVYPADGVVEDAIPSWGQIALFVGGTPPEKAAALALFKKHNVDKFIASIDAGTAAVRRSVRPALAQCPTAQIVLAGYSQGAMAVHAAESDMAAEHDPALTHVVGTLLLADGDRVRESAA